MRILIVGRDGRSYSIGKRLAAEGNTLFFAPGNGACWQFGDVWDIDVEDPTTTPRQELEKSVRKAVFLAQQLAVDLAIVTSIEASLAGLTDALREAGILVYGVGRKGIELEARREVGSRVCEKYGVKAPEWVFCSDVDEAIRYVRESGKAYVIKNNKLMGGKGIAVCEDHEETLFMLEYFRDVMESLILQEKIDGVEISAGVSVCGSEAELVGWTTTFEHKRVNDQDLGTLCAEMGTLLLSGVSDRVLGEFEKIRPYLKEVGYTGFLDINFILEQGSGDLKMLEFTTRFGDPQTEIMIPLIGGSMTDLFYQWASGHPTKPEFAHACGVGVVLAGGGYPYDDQVIQGLPIMFLADVEDSVDFMSAVRSKSGQAYTRGGRHLIALGYGESVAEAQSKAYWVAKNVRFLDMFYRTDIGGKWRLGERDTCIECGVVEDGMGGFDQWGIR